MRAAYGIVRSLVIYYGQPWKRRRMDALYARFVRPGDLCFDVGAHVGNRVGCFRRLGARVLAVEPQPDCVAVLRRLYGRDPDVAIEAVGVADRAGTGQLSVVTTNPTVSTLSAEWQAEVGPLFGVRWDRTLEVPLVTMDALIARHGEPAFAKIDVEGFEEQVLAGLSRPLRALSFEFVPAALPRALACIDRLEGLARYRYAVSLGETHRIDEADQDADGIRAWLHAAGPRSGDVYAVRDDGGPVRARAG